MLLVLFLLFFVSCPVSKHFLLRFHCFSFVSLASIPSRAPLYVLCTILYLLCIILCVLIVCIVFILFFTYSFNLFSLRERLKERRERERERETGECRSERKEYRTIFSEKKVGGICPSGISLAFRYSVR